MDRNAIMRRSGCLVALLGAPWAQWELASRHATGASAGHKDRPGHHRMRPW